MRVMVLGAGAVGAYYGGRLAAAGHDVTFVARGEHLLRLRHEGLTIESVLGDVTLRDVRAQDAHAPWPAADLVLVAAKTWKLEELLYASDGPSREDAVFVTVQNGLEAPHDVAARVGQASVLPGSVRLFAELVGPGRVRHSGGPGSISFGEWSGPVTPRVAELADHFRAAGVPAEPVDDAWASLWRKLIFVAPFGALGAATEAPIGVLRSRPELRRLLRQLMEEIKAVAAVHGIGLDEDVVDNAMSFIDGQPDDGVSSLQRDLARGGGSELDAWTGAVVRLARQADVPVPVNECLHSVLRYRAETAATPPEATFNADR
jgi:2-dehydropantoate 2-reductase